VSSRSKSVGYSKDFATQFCGRLARPILKGIKMTKFEEHGFLSDETLQLKNKLRKDYAEWFEVLYLINGYCQNLALVQLNR
jgi:hypothetical protein